MFVASPCNKPTLRLHDKWLMIADSQKGEYIFRRILQWLSVSPRFSKVQVATYFAELNI
jgi:hypothetical protein